MPNPVRPRHVADRSRVLRTRFIFAIKALAAMAWSAPPRDARGAVRKLMPIQALVVCSPLISDKRQVEWSARNRRGSRWNRLVRS